MLTRVEGYNYSPYILCMCMWHLSVFAKVRNRMTETEIWLHEWFVKLLLGCMLCGVCESNTDTFCLEDVSQNLLHAVFVRIPSCRAAADTQA